MSQINELGISLGGTLYSGELQTTSLHSSLRNTRPAFGLFARHQGTHNFAWRINFLYGKLAGSDKISEEINHQARNLEFESKIFEMGCLIEWNIARWFPTEDGYLVTLHLVGGGAVLFHNPVANFQGQNISLQALGTEGQGMEGYAKPYSLRLFTIPIGGGIKFQINDHLFLQTEILGRITFSDYLDDVSGYYVDYAELLAGNGKLSADLSNRSFELIGEKPPEAYGKILKRGNPESKDYYYSGTISIYYRIPSKKFILMNPGKYCPKF